MGVLLEVGDVAGGVPNHAIAVGAGCVEPPAVISALVCFSCSVIDT